MRTLARVHEQVDYILDAINCSGREQMDVGLEGSDILPQAVVRVFNQGDCGTLSYEAKFNYCHCFCWGVDEALHSAWVASH